MMSGQRATVIFLLLLIVSATGRAAHAQSANQMNWTGFHAGVNLGFDWLSGQPSSTQTLSSGAVTRSVQISPGPGSAGGVLFGGQLGYDSQFNSVLIGLETDIQASNVSDRAIGKASFGTTTSTIQDRQTLSWLGTTRVRLGYVIDNFVPYATGGLAYGGAQMNTFANTTLTGGSLSQSASRSATLLGFAVGGGVDYAFDTAWAVRLEALYYDLGSLSLSAPGTSTPPGVTGVLQSSAHFTGGLVRIGINLHL